MNRGRWIRTGLILTVALISSAVQAWSQSPVRLTVEVIQASRNGNAVDPSLGKLRAQLKSLNYSSYQLLASHPLATTIGAKQVVALPGGKSLDLFPYGLSGETLELLVTITDGTRRLLDTTFRLSNGGTILVGGPAHGDGVLILAITGSF